jgi:hypothetical protein
MGDQQCGNNPQNEISTQSKAESKKKKKTKTDPNAPRKPLSGFILFSKANRGEIEREAKKNRDDVGDTTKVTNTEIFKLLGKAWGKASDDVKEYFNTQYKDAKVQYEKDLAIYNKGDCAAVPVEQPTPVKPTPVKPSKAKMVKQKEVAPAPAPAPVVEPKPSEVAPVVVDPKQKKKKAAVKK